MGAILRNLYEGGYSPEEEFLPRIEELVQLRKRQIEDYECFLNKLEPELQEEFTAIMDGQAEEIPPAFYEMFLYGFRLGAKMMVEVFEKD